jgi:hypothetical protein
MLANIIKYAGIYIIWGQNWDINSNNVTTDLIFSGWLDIDEHLHLIVRYFGGKLK